MPRGRKPNPDKAEKKSEANITTANGRAFFEKNRFHTVFKAIQNQAESMGEPAVEITKEGKEYVGRLVRVKDGKKELTDCWMRAASKDEFPK